MRRLYAFALVLALLAGTGFVAVHAQDAAQNPAEIAFWSSVKDAKNPAELRAYLTAFPNGLFSQLARLRIEELEKPQTAPAAPARATAPSPPSPQQTPSTPATAVDFSSTSVIREIQLKLYDLNYDPSRVDGVMVAATRTAIREWQEIAGLPATGNMTDEHMQRLRNSKPSATWAAVAYTARGAHGAVFGKPSRAAAEQEAIDQCIKRGGRGAQCKPITAAGSACITMASYTTRRGNTTYFGSHVSLQPTQTASISRALSQCNEAANSGANCAAKVTICADGSHRK